MHLIILALVIGCTLQVECLPQQIKSVKSGGGNGKFPYDATANLVRFFNNTPILNHNNTSTNYETGVCYIEVPTIKLARDPANVPAGNGSSPDLSRIRVCCEGYIRNIHNFKICDPVCSQDCVNGLCTAPETCTCFPEHVRNLAGFCIPTCPIGCQNGFCSGGECMCNEGHKLDKDGKFCTPVCDQGCGGLGNCTAPNTCECKQGYKTSTDGACEPVCESCINGRCVAPEVCQCNQGYVKVGEVCEPVCDKGCKNGKCIGPNVCQCDEGYQANEAGTCQPACEYCTNGDCIGPNNCLCHQGYIKNEAGQCAPFCRLPCDHGKCISPDVCECEVDYRVENGTCKKKNSPCTNCDPAGGCNPGFVKSEYGECIPDCPGGCGVGQCIAPKVCSCPAGTEVDLTGLCVFKCAMPCVNAVCGDGNTCICKPGYVRDRTDPTGSRCVPSCPGGCPNGVCSAPNFCICNMGYVKDRSVKGRQTCVKRY